MWTHPIIHEILPWKISKFLLSILIVNTKNEKAAMNIVIHFKYPNNNKNVLKIPKILILKVDYWLQYRYKVCMQQKKIYVFIVYNRNLKKRINE